LLRITKQADYAIVLLSHFITDDVAGDYTARGLSVSTGIPLPMVGKILKALVHRGLLISHRGVKGGYQLARPGAEISVATIIEAIDGPIGLTTCSVHTGECAHEGRCPSRPNWNRINAAVLQSLRGISLADMARPMSFPQLVPAAQPLAGEIA
jgi:FeS assembly SUF system regulator